MRQTTSLSMSMVLPRHPVFAGCRQPLLACGPSRHYLRDLCMGVWTRTPLCPSGAFCSFLPGRLRPHVRVKTFGTQDSPCNAASTGETLSGLQSFVYLQAPILARPPSCTYRCVSTGQSGRLHHASPGSLPIPGCGIATCSTRATNTAGLSPARSRPCRPLLTPPFPLPSAEGGPILIPGGWFTDRSCYLGPQKWVSSFYGRSLLFRP